MQAVTCKIYYSLAKSENKYRFRQGGHTIGFMDVWPDRLEIFQGAGTYPSGGKSIPALIINPDMISSWEKETDGRGQLQQCIIRLKDSRCIYFGFIIDREYKAEDQALLRFLERSFEPSGQSWNKAEESSRQASGQTQSRAGETTENQDALLYGIYEQANYYHDQEDYEKEINYLEGALQAFPSDATLLVKAGRVYRNLGVYSKAIEYYSKALKITPDAPMIYSNIGVAYLSDEQNEMAMVFLEKALRLLKDRPSAVTAYDQGVVYGQYALCVGRLGDLSAAENYLRIAESKGYSSESIGRIKAMLGMTN